MQLITTTHSPFTAQQAGKGELFILDRIEKDIVIEEFDSNPQELLLHQLVMSDVFGLETDESLFIEQLKSERNRLLDFKEKSEDQMARLAEINGNLNSIPNQSYTNSLLNDEDQRVLSEVLKYYKDKNSNNEKTH